MELGVSAVSEALVAGTGISSALQRSSAGAHWAKKRDIMRDLLVYIGSPATLALLGPVALRPRLTTGLPFR